MFLQLLRVWGFQCYDVYSALHTPEPEHGMGFLPHLRFPIQIYGADSGVLSVEG